MISYLEALSILEKNSQQLPSEEITTPNSNGRIASADIYSPIDLPSFDNSAMDGFAVRYTETISASADKPILFLVNNIIPAGVQAQSSATDQLFTCSEIMTGAAVPLGYDAVIPIELVEEVIYDGKPHIKLKSEVTKFANIRFSGEDVRHGALILKSGSQIKPGDIMLLHALGITSIKVFKQISIAIASTGNEVSDKYDQPLRYGEIYNSNSPLLLNLAAVSCFKARYSGILPDDIQALCDFIQQSKEQVLITTGAVSKGKWDFIPETLCQLGADILFHSVAIRPGKPILFARLNDGRFFFGLPGNPVSSMVGWRFFATPLFYSMWGKEAEQPLRLKLNHKFKKNHALRQFLKAEMSIEDGIAYATIDVGQESFKIKPLTTSNIWAVATETDTQMEAGGFINAFPLYTNL